MGDPGRTSRGLGWLVLSGILLAALVLGIRFLVPPQADTRVLVPGLPADASASAEVTSTFQEGYPPPKSEASGERVTPTHSDPYPPAREAYPPPEPGPVYAPSPTADLNPPHTPVSDAAPTPTWLPTRPPAPTPTLNFSPLAQSFPPPKAPDSPAGRIWYGVQSGEDGYASDLFVLPIGESAEALGLPETVALPPTLDDRPILEIHPSPDGRYWVIIVPMEPVAYALVFDPATGMIKDPLINIGAGNFFGWHPDGSNFLFYVHGGGPWMVNAESENIFPLAVTYLIQGAAISPDGMHVAYIADEFPSDKLWIVGKSGSQFMAETGSRSRIYPGAWSPDGTQLVYYGACGDPEALSSAPLCLLDLESGNQQPLNIPSFAGYATDWSSNGRYMAAVGYDPEIEPCSYEDEGIEAEICAYIGRVIYLQDMQTGEVRKLADGLNFAWSPDGSRLVFLSAQSGAPEVWMIAADGSGLRQLTKDGKPKNFYLLWQGSK